MKKNIFFIIVFLCFLPLTIKNVYALDSTYTNGIVNNRGVNVRTGPGTNYAVVKTNTYSNITVSYPEGVEVLSHTNGWTQIRLLYNGFLYTGYISSQYLDETTYNLDINYYNSLISSGFPSVYAEKLTKLHAVRPNWNFVPSFTNVSLNDAALNEYSPIYKNLISTSDTRLLSTDGAAYSNGTYIQFEPGWYAPSIDTLKYYMDPRNFIDNSHIFMFEQLSYDSKVTEADVQKVLNGSFMEGSYSYNGEIWTYAKTFLTVGKEYGVNPVHLAARVLQEQGMSGSATGAMNGSDGLIYHNYFNFGATGSSASEIIGNALNYAMKNGWSNPYLAIKGGASGIANGYISNRQDTLYYQKFNIIGDGKYWHQYMANITAPYTESYQTYKSYYNSNLINTAFTFKIPVYSDMKEQTIVPQKSNNNNLNSLNITNCTLSPTFDSAITSYTCEVENKVDSVKITGTIDNSAKVKGLGDVKLSEGENKIKIEVTAENGTNKTYEVVITRKKAEAGKSAQVDVIKSVGLKNDNDNLTGFTLGSDVSSISKLIKDKNSNVTIKIFDSSDKAITNGLISTGQKIELTLNNSTKKYNVVVSGDTNGDGKIEIGDYSKIKAYIQGKIKIDGSYLLASDTNRDGKIEIGDYSKIKAYIQGRIKSLE